VKGIVPMCAPMTDKNKQKVQQGVLKYAREYKQYEGKQKDQVDQEMETFEKIPMDALTSIHRLSLDVYKHIDYIYAPVFVVQARHDEMIDMDSAKMIVDKVESEDKSLKWYEHSTHVITFGDEKEQ